MFEEKRREEKNVQKLQVIVGKKRGKFINNKRVKISRRFRQV